MKPLSIKLSSNQVKLAACAVMGSLSLVTGSASAQAAPPAYAPHADLTPYQIVSNDGKCLQASNEPDFFNGWTAQVADCSSSNLQKFYVLNEGSATDYVPKTDMGYSSSVWIVLAPALDRARSPGNTVAQYPGFSFLAPYSSNGGHPGGTPSVLANAAQAQRWQVLHNGPRQQLKYVAGEGMSFGIAGTGAWITYGAAFNWTPVTFISTDPTTKYATVACNNATFGDPNKGVVKECRMQTDNPNFDPYVVQFSAFGIPADCLYSSNSALGWGLPCSDSESQWTLRRTTYPI